MNEIFCTLALLVVESLGHATKGSLAEFQNLIQFNKVSILSLN